MACTDQDVGARKTAESSSTSSSTSREQACCCGGVMRGRVLAGQEGFTCSERAAAVLGTPMLAEDQGFLALRSLNMPDAMRPAAAVTAQQMRPQLSRTCMKSSMVMGSFMSSLLISRISSGVLPAILRRMPFMAASRQMLVMSSPLHMQSRPTGGSQRGEGR